MVVVIVTIRVIFFVVDVVVCVVVTDKLQCKC